MGDNVTAGPCYGKVRAMMDDKGRRVKEAGPSMPVEILGLNDVPGAGDVLMATENEKEARSYAETFISESKNKLLADTKAKISLDDLFSQIKAGNVKELPIIVKADVQGSVEAVKQSLVKLSNEEVVVKVIHGGVGAINESDVSLASASTRSSSGFNVRPDATAKSIADREKVTVCARHLQAIEDVEAAMKGMLDPCLRTGHQSQLSARPSRHPALVPLQVLMSWMVSSREDAPAALPVMASRSSTVRLLRQSVSRTMSRKLQPVTSAVLYSRSSTISRKTIW